MDTNENNPKSQSCQQDEGQSSPNPSEGQVSDKAENNTSDTKSSVPDNQKQKKEEFILAIIVLFFIIIAILLITWKKTPDASQNTKVSDHDIADEIFYKVMPYVIRNADAHSAYSNKTIVDEINYVESPKKNKAILHYNFESKALNIEDYMIMIGNSGLIINGSMGSFGTNFYYKEPADPLKLHGKWYREIGDSADIFVSFLTETNQVIVEVTNAKMIHDGSKPYFYFDIYQLNSMDSVVSIINNGIKKLAESNNTEYIPMVYDKELAIAPDVRDFLQYVYPNDTSDYMALDATTTRFREYAAKECDYEPVYKTQDSYACGRMPNPEFRRDTLFQNAYKVTWHRYEEDEIVENTVVLTKINGKYKIDNIIEYDKNGKPWLLFDYSKPPVQYWNDDYEEEAVLPSENESEDDA